MDSNLQWVEQNLQKQRKILEEKQKQRRLQSAGPVRATFNSPFNSANSQSIISSPIPTAPIVYRHAEDLISHSISTTNPPGSLSLSSEPYTDFDAFSTTTTSTTTNNFSTSMTTIPSRTPPIHQRSGLFKKNMLF
uniref:Uncharacterized protein n=1 Tax=Panagrolaimus sp. PS1159 TaxID=55785 RepID=A0AC35F7M2_9BILA